LGGLSIEERLAYWRNFNAKRGNLTAAYENPAERDVTLLRCQLEPWSTAHLRLRLSTVFGEDHVAMDALSRGDVMSRLLHHYETTKQQRRCRKTIKVLGTPVDPMVCAQLLSHLRNWSQIHKVNSRPSINATSYMILRSPSEFGQPQQQQPQGKAQQPQPSSQDNNNNNNNNNKVPAMSKKARIAAKKLRQFQPLWDLAKKTLATIDPIFARSFSALAVTKNFRGSPHIDKQNTGPFYGLSLGNFDDGTGGVCVEADAFTVAHVNTKGRLAKVDGRYPHWVAPYTYHELDNNADILSEQQQEEERCRYSLIFYSTKQSYCQPGPAYFGEVMEEGKNNVNR